MWEYKESSMRNLCKILLSLLKMYEIKYPNNLKIAI